MAKGINVQITAGSGGTPVSYALSRNINGAGFTVIEASLAYTASPQTYQDDNGGAGFSDADVVEYRATATNVDGTSSNSAVQSHTVSSSGGVTNTIKTIKASNSIFADAANRSILNTVGDYVEFRNHDWSNVLGNFYYLEHGGNGGGIQLIARGVNLVRLIVRYDTNQSFLSNNIAVANGDLIRIERTATAIVMRVNGTIAASQTVASYADNPDRMAFGSNFNTAQFEADAEFSDLDINGETWDFAEQAGTSAVGSASTVLTLKPGTATVGDMWGTL